MNKENIIYAAYGSNLNLRQMEYRCPYATVIGNAVLPGYKLLFRGYDGGAVATVEPEAGGIVPVLLWEITPRDEEALDRYEGWPHLYRKETVAVQYGKKLPEVMVYIMNEGKPLGAPGEQYYNAIKEGYISAGFDIETLKRALEDSNAGQSGINDIIVAQIMDIRASGKVNMLDANGVQWEANERGFYELVIFIEDEREAYSRFILTGER